jgi:hypothetical protein
VGEERFDGVHPRRPADDLRHQPGQLADDVGPACELRDLLPPLRRIRTDPGLADMVEHELDVRSAADELDRLIQLRAAHADVEGELEIGQRRDTLQEVIGDGEAGLLVLDQPPDTHHQRNAAQGLEVVPRLRASLQRRERDDAAHPRQLSRLLEQPLDLSQPLSVGAVALDDDEVGHRSRRREQGRGIDQPVQLGAVQPGVAQSAGIPEVHVCVNDPHRLRCQTSVNGAHCSPSGVPGSRS